MIEITQTKYTVVKISEEEANAITIRYLSEIIIGEGCHVTKDNCIEHWTSWPHGSGTTTDKGKATKLQLNASKILKGLRDLNT